MSKKLNLASFRTSQCELCKGDTTTTDMLHGGKFSVFSSPDFCINTPGKALFDRAEACLESNQSRSEPSTAQRCIWIVFCLLINIFFLYVISQELKTVSLVLGILIRLSTIFINFVSLLSLFRKYIFLNTGGPHILCFLVPKGNHEIQGS